jgi:hypothetical protein
VHIGQIVLVFATDNDLGFEFHSRYWLRVFLGCPGGYDRQAPLYVESKFLVGLWQEEEEEKKKKKVSLCPPRFRPKHVTV